MKNEKEKVDIFVSPTFINQIFIKQRKTHKLDISQEVGGFMWSYFRDAP